MVCYIICVYMAYILDTEALLNNWQQGFVQEVLHVMTFEPRQNNYSCVEACACAWWMRRDVNGHAPLRSGSRD